jgi:hypothetical protein
VFSLSEPRSSGSSAIRHGFRISRSRLIMTAGTKHELEQLQRGAGGSHGTQQFNSPGVNTCNTECEWSACDMYIYMSQTNTGSLLHAIRT